MIYLIDGWCSILCMYYSSECGNVMIYFLPYQHWCISIMPIQIILSSTQVVCVRSLPDYRHARPACQIASILGMAFSSRDQTQNYRFRVWLSAQSCFFFSNYVDYLSILLLFPYVTSQNALWHCMITPTMKPCSLSFVNDRESLLC